MGVEEARMRLGGEEEGETGGSVTEAAVMWSVVSFELGEGEEDEETRWLRKGGEVEERVEK